MNRSTKNLLSRLTKALPSGKTQGRPAYRSAGLRFTRNDRLRAQTVNASWGRSLPAAYASHVRPRFNVVSRTATSARVSGCDLIYPIPAALEPSQDTIFAIFPANPAYWTGTRIAQFAPAYQNYRPLSFTVSYIPQVAVTQAGTVFMGSLWNEAAPSSNVQQSLFTSNGGCLTQCYVPCDTSIRCASNLSQNLFTMAGALHPDTCPFLFLAGVRGASVVPGYFYVTYTYEFKNPIGSAWQFKVNPNTTVSALNSVALVDNMTVVLLSGSGDLGPGTQLDLEVEPTGPQLYYHGSPVDIAGDTPVQVYMSYQSNRDRTSTTLVGVRAGQEETLFANFRQATTPVQVPANRAAVYYNAGGAISFINNTTEDQVPIPAPTRYAVFPNSTTVHLLNADGDTVLAIQSNSSTDWSTVALGSGYRIQQ